MSKVLDFVSAKEHNDLKAEHAALFQRYAKTATQLDVLDSINKQLISENNILKEYQKIFIEKLSNVQR